VLSLLAFWAETLLAGLIIYTAALSPRPPLHTREYGGLLVIFANFAFSGVFAFCSTMVYLTIRRRLLPHPKAPPARQVMVAGARRKHAVVHDARGEYSCCDG
jgi:hypothetical protein